MKPQVWIKSRLFSDLNSNLMFLLFYAASYYAFFLSLLKLLYRRRFVDLSFEKYHLTTNPQPCIFVYYRFAVGVVFVLYLLCRYRRATKNKPVFKSKQKNWMEQENIETVAARKKCQKEQIACRRRSVAKSVHFAVPSFSASVCVCVLRSKA